MLATGGVEIAREDIPDVFGGRWRESIPHWFAVPRSYQVLQGVRMRCSCGDRSSDEDLQMSGEQNRTLSSADQGLVTEQVRWAQRQTVFLAK